MPVDVQIPTLGESVTEGVIVRWLKADGDVVRADDALLELETDKANVELPSPGAGTLRRLKKEGETVRVGEVVAQIEPKGKSPSASTPSRTPTATASTSATPAPASPPGAPSPTGSAAPSPPAAAAAGADATAELSPAVRRLVTEHNLDAAAIKGSGRGGRLTKADVLTHLEQQDTREPVDGAQGERTTDAGPTPTPSAP